MAEVYGAMLCSTENGMFSKVMYIPRTHLDAFGIQRKVELIKRADKNHLNRRQNHNKGLYGYLKIDSILRSFCIYPKIFCVVKYIQFFAAKESCRLANTR